MRLKGNKVQPPKPKVIVIPRDDGDLIFMAQSVLDFSEFDRLCPIPRPPKVHRPNQVSVEDHSNSRYLEQITKYNSLRFAWLIITSLRITDGLEWETVDYNNPETWEKYESELKDSGFNQGEITALTAGVIEANSLDESRAREARERFLHTQDQVVV